MTPAGRGPESGYRGDCRAATNDDLHCVRDEQFGRSAATVTVTVPGLTVAKMAECRWLRPVLVGQFEYVEWTSDAICASYYTSS
jgi:hypothetical protein